MGHYARLGDSMSYGRYIEIKTESATISNEFRISLDLTLMLSNTGASGTVTIWNLSRRTHNQIRDNNKRIQIIAGYKDNKALLFDGNLIYVNRIQQMTERGTQLTLGQNSYLATDSIYLAAKVGNQKIRDIISEIAKHLSLTVSQQQLDKIPITATVNNWTSHGDSATALTTLLAPYDIVWRIEHKNLLLDKEKHVDDPKDVYVLKPETGLIKAALTTERGVSCSTELNAKLTPSTIVKIESEEVQGSVIVYNPKDNPQGFYKIIQSEFQGDNKQGSFTTNLQTVVYQ